MNEPLNLIPAIKELQKRKNELIKEFQRKVRPLQDSIEHLRKLNEVCERCEGKGWNLRTRVCAEDDRPDPNDPRDRIICDVCHGTGLKTNEGG